VKTTKKQNKDKRKCLKCKIEKLPNHFYNSNSPMFDGKAPICKDCIKKYVDYDDMNSVYDILRQLDIKFSPSHWESAITSKYDTIGTYIRMANSLPEFKGTGWNDSTFEQIENNEKNNINSKESDYKQNVFNPKNYVPSDEILDKWGFGYEPEEYYYFEKKYQQLKDHYPEKTAMHTEALLTYIRYRVKEELATAAGRSKEAKEWGTLAKDAAQAAKINPSQLSKADLSDGLDSFGQLTRSVEQAVDIIEILPKFKERPQDKVDVTIWCYINYVRDLFGMPPVEYKEIYKFYEDRKKEYELMLEDVEDNAIL